MEDKFVIKRKEFKKLERYAENIYNTAVVIDYSASLIIFWKAGRWSLVPVKAWSS